MVTLSVKADFKDVQRKLNSLSRDVERRVVPASLNKVATKAKTEMSRQITSEYNIKSDVVRSSLRISKASRDINRWKVVLDPFLSSRRRGRSLNLIRFMEKSVSLTERRRRIGRGVANKLHFRIKKQGGLKTIDGAFLANNGRTVFVRAGNERLPIKPLQVIGVPQMFNTRRINSLVIARINQELPIEFERAISAVLAGKIR